jgi:RHH-type proline utilization regulon transcriptional repressor/proline dehydrogenase/delta 1-pyrroline-5-carboxylate dehydrogenase
MADGRALREADGHPAGEQPPHPPGAIGTHNIRNLDYVAAGKRQGARALLELPPSADDGYYVPPTILEVQPDNVLAREEVFGPVLAVLKVKDFHEALALLNATDYALTGGIYTRTPSHIERFKREAQMGNRYVNRAITGAVVERQAVGGFKMSGAGSKAGGADYLLHFMLPVANAEPTDRRGHIPGIEDAARSL